MRLFTGVLVMVSIAVSIDPEEPKQHRHHGSYKIYLNEVFLPSFSGDIFVELGKYCPITANEAARSHSSLIGYQVLVLSGTETLKVYAKRMLHGEDLIPVTTTPTRTKISYIISSAF